MSLSHGRRDLVFMRIVIDHGIASSGGSYVRGGSPQAPVTKKARLCGWKQTTREHHALKQTAKNKANPQRGDDGPLGTGMIGLVRAWGTGFEGGRGSMVGCVGDGVGGGGRLADYRAAAWRAWLAWVWPIIVPAVSKLLYALLPP